MIWKQPTNEIAINEMGKHTLMETLGIQVIEVGPDFIKATMPVDHRTVQPFRILHGGASVALAESLGSFAGTLCLENLSTHTIVGVEINANHLKAVKEGEPPVVGTVKPIRIGKTIQVWQIDICNAKNQLTCTSRITLAVIPLK
jgi:1,4-dihydroxy-2-naphthoyl-CoA hydrolase